MFKWLLPFLFVVTSALAQNATGGSGGSYCPTLAIGSNGNVCASTAFVVNSLANYTTAVLPSVVNSAVTSALSELSTYDINVNGGVNCDGSTNVSAAFQAAVTAAIAAGKEARWTGTCIVSNISVPNTFKMTGAGRGLSILKRPASDSSGNVILSISGSGVILRDFTVDGNKSNETVNSAANIYFTTGGKFTADNIESINAKGGVGLSVYNTNDGTSETRSKVVNSTFLNNDLNGISVRLAQYIDIIGNQTSYNGSDAIVYINYVFPPVAYSQIVSNIIGNTVSFNSGTGINICCGISGGTSSLPQQTANANSSAFFVVNGNIVNSNMGYGIAGYGQNITISGNTIFSNGAAGQASGGINGLGSGLTVVGNTLYNNLMWSIDLGGSTHCQISNNTINGMAYLASYASTYINAGATKNCSVVGNNIFVSFANSTAINLSQLDYGGGDNLGAGSGVIVSQNSIDLASTTSLGVLSVNFGNLMLKDNQFYNTTGANQAAVIQGSMGAIKQSGNFDVAQSQGGSATFVASGSTLIIPDVGDEFYVTGSTTINNIQTYSMSQNYGTVLGVQMSAGGVNYTQASPGIVTFSGGGCTTEPTGTPVATNSGSIIGVTMTGNGAGCTSAPAAVFSGGAGSGATGSSSWGSANFESRHITLMFLGASTVNNGANLHLSSSHTMSAGYSVLKLVGEYTGSTQRWQEEGFVQ